MKVKGKNNLTIGQLNIIASRLPVTAPAFQVCILVQDDWNPWIQWTY